ncbi:cytochrome P450 [Parafrankia sp. EUN1f]|uniref:cytochrome P450 n=1 Tax=Parafrankia sp. EUN1f TaxID=102897 RepID=UPI0001C4741A|nr:cytochrome P450 [Parafrankia sp. EUN1f]EFC86318.1 cytochrome P450 [Parafrankia sp. EUN1f]
MASVDTARHSGSGRSNSGHGNAGHGSYPHSHDPAARPPAPVWPSSRTFRDATPDQKLAYLRRLRDDPSLPVFDEPPIPGLPRGSGYRALTRHADVVEVSRRPGDFCSGQGTLWINDFGPELNEFFGSLINIDDPRHGQLRRLVVAAFTPRTVRRLYDNLGALAAETVASAARRSTLDLVADLATPFPLAVIGDLLGIPESCRDDMLPASNIIMSGGDPEFVRNQQDPVSAFLKAGNDLATLATELAEDRRRRPADDLLTELVQAEVDGTRLSTQEIASFFILLAIAGQETTRNAISLGLWALHNNPAAHQAWAADFDRLAPTAVEEILRYCTPIATMRRTVTHDTALNEHHLTVGDKVLLFYAAANRDERIFPEPDRFDITRTSNPHLSFGGPGPHFCLGSHLARAELTAIFREIFRSLPRIEITDEPEFLRSIFVNGVKRLGARA